MASRDAPTPPEPLGEAGMAFWRDVHADYEGFTPTDLRLIASAAACLDRVAAMEAEQAGLSLVAVGSMKQPVAAPLLAEIRQYRALFLSLCRQLALETDDDQPATRRGWNARQAAAARWSGRGAHLGGA